ncbi:Wall-associated receptor kinase-like 20 [Frankliniella fusca]|uniref:Wall-associated receptor kinase-like 20 n=1 Tax=Frankliniella fusca TaxID=407009 RepID=A0AAE1GQP1_9NEOP|nr:Wall-associated receptor kinase-like 20 [Frankliniella fusca]
MHSATLGHALCNSGTCTLQLWDMHSATQGHELSDSNSKKKAKSLFLSPKDFLGLIQINGPSFAENADAFLCGSKELRTQIENIIKKVIGLEDDDTKILLDHILSRRIGVKKISDLEEMAIENLPSGLLGEIPAKRLIKAFHKAAQGSSGSRSRSPIAGTSRNNNQVSNEGSMSNSSEDNDDPTQVIPFGEGEFTYIINWNDMPRKSVRALEKAKEQNKVGDDEDINDIKLALAAKNKSVVRRFGVAMQEELNGVVHGNGLHTFKRR